MQAAALNGTFDVFMLNFYTARYVFNQPGALGEWGAGRTDAGTTFVGANGQRIGPESCAPSWFAITPWAMRKMLNWVDSRRAPRTACTCCLYSLCWMAGGAI